MRSEGYSSRSVSHGAVLCVYVILFLKKIYECFLSLEAVCVFVCMHVDVCELGTLGCVGRVG